MNSQKKTRPDDTERGAALLSALLVMLLMAGVTAGFTALVVTDARVRVLDSTRTSSFYAVHAGLEKLTADLGDLFAANVAPSATQVNALMENPPDIGVTWERPDGSSGYRITFPVDEDGNADARVMTVQNGPFQGLVGLATTYDIEVTGRLQRIQDGGETALTRRLQTVAIPVFQFGIFSENDLSFFPGPTFNFGGRVHSNQNIFLATRAAAPGLTLSERVTSVGEIVRRRLSNGMSTEADGYTGVVRGITAPNTFRNLAMTEGSVTDGLGSALNTAWESLSTGTYNSNIMNGRTGARRLDLPIAMFSNDGPIALIKRPAVNENVDNPNLLNERFYSLASLRILLSDTAADIANLPGVNGTPIELGATISGTYTPTNNINTPRPRIAQSPATSTTGTLVTAAGKPLIGGWILIEKQTTPGTWVDVTTEILSLGFNSPQLHRATPGVMEYVNYHTTGTDSMACRDWTPNAIVRFQRLWDTGGSDVNGCFNQNEALSATGTAGNNAARRYTPLALYDPREGLMRDSAPTSMQLGGIMHYIELDARNLARWFRGQIPAVNCPIACTGANALNVNGYTVYFSDRRGNRNSLTNLETGEYGFEDFVNPASAASTPNGSLDTGEDVNGNETLDVYGGEARAPYGITWAELGGHLTSSATPLTQVGTTDPVERARRNPPIFFRRALKLTRGANLVGAASDLQGLTIASENPVYIQGDWNSTGGNFNGTHVATAVLADAVTLLSNNWNDRNSFVNPHTMSATQRNASTTWYRVAIIAGKGISFTRPTVGVSAGDFGTDGGAHNFLRFIERWDGQTLNYRGSIASLFVSRQAVGTYKCCNTVYGAPTRGYNFDAEFLTPALLPPRTPMFRDVNITGFSQIIRP